MRYSCQMTTKPTKVAMLVNQSAAVKCGGGGFDARDEGGEGDALDDAGEGEEGGGVLALEARGQLLGGGGRCGIGGVHGCVSSVGGGTIRRCAM